jgi:general secretion pathway protein H
MRRTLKIERLNGSAGSLRQAGFTLIEIMVVLVIIAMTAALVLPRLPDTEAGKLKSSARNLASGIRFLNDQAIMTKGLYRLQLNLTDASVTISKVSQSGEELPPDDQFMNRRLIEEGIAIEDVTDPQLGTVTEGQVVIPFGPGGNRDPLIIHLKGDKGQYTVIAYPSGGKVQVLEGYQEMPT